LFSCNTCFLPNSCDAAERSAVLREKGRALQLLDCEKAEDTGVVRRDFRALSIAVS